MITLQRSDLTLRLNPEVGGSVDSFLRGSTPLLRPAPQGSTNALDQAAYPLIPFTGRIANGVFTFNKKQIKLPSNMPPEPHAIHGQGWQSAWQVIAQSASAATIALNYSGGDWPWRYRATQTFELSDNSLTLTMGLHNLASDPMPAGLGWHPFFPKDDAALMADVALIWPSGNDMIPQPPVPSEEVEQLNAGVKVSTLDLDNAFSTAGQRARLQWFDEPRAIELRWSEDLSHLVIYTPPNENFFCVEPVSHAPNCLNSALPAEVTGARVLAPNEAMQAVITLAL